MWCSYEDTLCPVQYPDLLQQYMPQKTCCICRFAIGACSLQDLASKAHVKAIVAPTPKSVDRNRACRRAYLQRFFEVWRRHTAQHASRSRRACNFPQHLLVTSNAQFSGECSPEPLPHIPTIHQPTVKPVHVVSKHSAACSCYNRHVPWQIFPQHT